jgi:predicted DNA-binding transcriptional regulator YafY
MSQNVINIPYNQGEAEMTKPANRLLTLLMLLQRQPNQKAGPLAKELGVSVRTLHRYFALLDEMGIPLYTERGPHGGFSLVRGYKMPPLVFSPEEAAAVCLGTGLVIELWGHLYQEAARGALAKIENLLPEEQRGEVAWARRSLVTTSLYRPGLSAQVDKLEALRRVIHESRRVDMVYQSVTAAEAGARLLDPYALAHRAGWWYVVGYCHTRREVRLFRIDRIQELALSDESFQAPADFDARDFVSRALQAPQQVQVRLRFAKEAASIARMNRLSWETFEEQPSGAIVVKMSAPDLNWAASIVLSFGPAVEVLEPPELRRLVQAWSEAISRQYLLAGDGSVTPTGSNPMAGIHGSAS